MHRLNSPNYWKNIFQISALLSYLKYKPEVVLSSSFYITLNSPKYWKNIFQINAAFLYLNMELSYIHWIIGYSFQVKSKNSALITLLNQINLSLILLYFIRLGEIKIKCNSVNKLFKLIIWYIQRHEGYLLLT